MNLEKFGPVWDASGVRGFFEEGYWFHLPFNLLFGLSFKGSTFVAKTTTVPANEGNMELTASYTPKRFFPDCVYVDLINGVVLNSVGLSGPGFETLLSTNRWQKITTPFFISVMPLGTTKEQQVAEMREFVRILLPRLREFATPQLGIQLNVSCPNVGADLESLIGKVDALLDVLTELMLPVVVKLNLLVSPDAASKIGKNPKCAGLCVANTTPFGQKLPQEVWNHYFKHGSPLEKRGYPAGGLSGHLNYPTLVQWIRKFRQIDKDTYLNACGGIDHKRKVIELKKEGADSISFATVAMTAPWNVRSIIKTAHEVFAPF